MKLLFSLLATLLALQTYAQQTAVQFFKGTWQVQGEQLFEHWDELAPNRLKGFAYDNSNPKAFKIIEYLDLKEEGKDFWLDATVMEQNQGKTIKFKGSKGPDFYQFENPKHDFPKIIRYQKLAPDSMLVTLAAGEKKISFTMLRVKTAINPDATTNMAYDEALAKKLGADAYGMKSFFFVVLKTGLNTTTDQTLIKESFQGHMANINRLVAEDKLIVAGPFGKNNDHYRGLFIFQNVKTEAELRELLLTDPAIKNELLSFSIYPWYGSAALPMYLPYSKKITKESL